MHLFAQGGERADVAHKKPVPVRSLNVLDEAVPVGRRGQWKPGFLAALRRTGNVYEACSSVGIQRTTAYAARKGQPDFARLWQIALDDAIDRLEYAAWKRATDSSDKLLMFLLQAHRPELYAKRTRQDIRLSKEKPQQVRLHWPEKSNNVPIAAEVEVVEEAVDAAEAVSDE